MYALKILPSGQRDLDSLDSFIFNQIKKKLAVLADNPRPPGCLKLTADQGYRLRSGDWRILYRVDDKTKIIYVYRIKHRKDAYR
ncbi:MAG: type II toxin-antitoxin system RelE/ParE family toxin [Elusimicrobia bacterium]|nr:type II toxin-antitoxin system RelE/ParE family toxin [Elusimicrobiota bacterium]